jgi:hypothetical protein
MEGSVKLTSPSQLSSGFPVTLTVATSGDGRISLSAYTVTVPGDGSSAKFTISGGMTSSRVNDISISASAGATSNAYCVTVFDLNAICTAIPAVNQSYTWIPNGAGGVASLMASGNQVTMTAKVNALPDGANPIGIQCGLVQNETSSSRGMMYGNPELIREQGDTTVVSAPLTLLKQWSIPAALDSGDINSSYYAGPVDVNVPAIGHDAPGIRLSNTVTINAHDSNGKFVGTIIYTAVWAHVDDTFADWCAVIDPDNGAPTYPASDGWRLNITSDNPSGITKGSGAGSPILADGHTPTATMLGDALRDNATYIPGGLTTFSP